MANLKKGDVVGQYRVEEVGSRKLHHIYLVCKVRDADRPDRERFVLKLFDSDSTVKQYDRFVALSPEAEKSESLCKIIDHGVDPKGKYVIMEAIRPKDEWAKNIQDHVADKGRLSLHAAWSVVVQVADAAEKLEKNGGHGQLWGEVGVRNILVVESESIRIKVVDWAKGPVADIQSDIAAIGNLLHYLLTGQQTIIKDPIKEWSTYKDSYLSQLKAIHLPGDQRSKIERILQKIFGSQSERYSSIDGFLTDMRGIPGILPVPPIYSYGLLMSLIVFFGGVTFLLYASTSHFLPGTSTPVAPSAQPTQAATSVSTMTITPSLPLKSAEPKPTEPPATSTPSFQTSTAQPITSTTQSTTSVSQAATPSPQATPSQPRPAMPLPSPTLATEIHLRPRVQHGVSVRERCGEGMEKGPFGGEVFHRVDAVLHVNDAYLRQSCVWVWIPHNTNPQGVNGYVLVDEVCVVAVDYDRGQALLGSDNWARVLATGLQRCR